MLRFSPLFLFYLLLSGQKLRCGARDDDEQGRAAQGVGRHRESQYSYAQLSTHSCRTAQTPQNQRWRRRVHLRHNHR